VNLAATLRGTTYRFRDLKQVLAKANEEKSGDRLAGLAADSVSERIAAKRVLAEVTLQELYENPVVPPEQDAVTRLILDDLQRPIYDSVKSWTVAKLREHVLSDEADGASLLRLSRGLTSEMIAACAKLMTNMDLVHAARPFRQDRYRPEKRNRTLRRRMKIEDRRNEQQCKDHAGGDPPAELEPDCIESDLASDPPSLPIAPKEVVGQNGEHRAQHHLKHGSCL